MTQELLKILNPVRILKVEDWQKMAIKVRNYESSNELVDLSHKASAFDLIQHYEALTSQPLTKAHFVCEVEEPALYRNWVADKTPDLPGVNMDNCNEYTKAQSQLIFAGFVQMDKESMIVYHTGIEGMSLSLSAKNIRIDNYFSADCIETVFDFIIEIDRYNRTATTPINISFTENFCKELLK